MSADSDFVVAADAEKVTRTLSIKMLKGLREQAAASTFGNGKIFSARWVAVGDQSTGPYICRKVLRFQVKKNLTGQGMSWSPADQGYLVVYEMVNRATALKRYRDQAGHRLEELEPQLETATLAAGMSADNLARASTAAELAKSALAVVEGDDTYPTKKAKEAALKPLRATDRQAQTAARKAAKDSERANNRRDKLTARVEEERLKTTDPVRALTLSLEAKVARLRTKLESKADDQVVRQRLAVATETLSDPVESLMSRYRILNVNGLLWLKINGKEYVVTTPPVPAIPENAVEETEDDEPLSQDPAPADDDEVEVSESDATDGANG